MTILSNTLADLAERVKNASAQSAEAEKTAIEKALEAGRLLTQAKGECQHGDWLPFLERAGIAERKAQRLMKLARSGMKSDTVTDFGGMMPALMFLSQLPEPPHEGHHMLVSLDGFSPEFREPFVVVTPADDGDLWIYRFDLSASAPWWEQPRRPARRDAMWPIVIRLLDGRASEMKFRLVQELPFDIGMLLGEMLEMPPEGAA